MGGQILKQEAAGLAEKATIIVGHPNPGGFAHLLAERVHEVWQAAGYDTELCDLVEEGFDPCLTEAEARGQPTSDALVRRHQERLLDSALLCISHPNYWSGPPAILKGWVDRVLAFNVAYRFEEGQSPDDPPVGLLPVRHALVLNTGDTPLAREVEVFGDPLEKIWTTSILGFCGVQSVTRLLYGPLVTSSADARDDWLSDAAQIAEELARG